MFIWIKEIKGLGNALYSVFYRSRVDVVSM